MPHLTAWGDDGVADPPDRQDAQTEGGAARYSKATTVIQFANEQKGVCVDLVTIAAASGTEELPEVVRMLLEKDEACKVFNDPSSTSARSPYRAQTHLSTAADARPLYDDFQIAMKNVVNIAGMVKAMEPSEFVHEYTGGVKLSSLSGIVLKVTLNKAAQGNSFYPPYSPAEKECKRLFRSPLWVSDRRGILRHGVRRRSVGRHIRGPDGEDIRNGRRLASGNGYGVLHLRLCGRRTVPMRNP